MSVRLPVLDDGAAMLPARQAAWVRDLLGDDALPAEPNATCDACAMLRDEDDPAGGTWFDPTTRCCTYLPDMANFLVGAALDDEASAFGAASVRARIASGVGATPLGLQQTRAFHATYDGNAAAFGRDPSLRCPHFEVPTGRCGVWAHREATCATWFCKHRRGAVHKAFWNRLHQLLRAAETAVARACALALGISPEGLAMLLPARGQTGALVAHDVVPTDAPDDPALHPRLWGPWAGREGDYYRACAAHAAALRGDDVLALGGVELRCLVEVVRHARTQTRDEALPARVALEGFQVLGLDAAGVRVQGYSFLDPLVLPRALFDVLRFFDGRPVDEALRAASEAAGEPVPPGAVRMLVDFGVLRGV